MRALADAGVTVKIVTGDNEAVTAVVAGIVAVYLCLMDLVKRGFYRRFVRS